MAGNGHSMFRQQNSPVQLCAVADTAAAVVQAGQQVLTLHALCRLSQPRDQGQLRHRAEQHRQEQHTTRQQGHDRQLQLRQLKHSRCAPSPGCTAGLTERSSVHQACLLLLLRAACIFFFSRQG